MSTIGWVVQTASPKLLDDETLGWTLSRRSKVTSAIQQVKTVKVEKDVGGKLSIHFIDTALSNLSGQSIAEVSESRVSLISTRLIEETVLRHRQNRVVCEISRCASPREELGSYRILNLLTARFRCFHHLQQSGQRRLLGGELT